MNNNKPSHLTKYPIEFSLIQFNYSKLLDNTPTELPKNLFRDKIKFPINPQNPILPPSQEDLDILYINFIYLCRKTASQIFPLKANHFHNSDLKIIFPPSINSNNFIFLKQAKLATLPTSNPPTPLTKQTKNQFHLNFKKLYSTNKNPHSLYPPNIINLSSYHQQADIKHSMFSPAQIKFTLNSWPYNKAFGADGISINLLKHIMDQTDLIIFLSKLFNLIFNTGNIPSLWTSLITKLIPKPQKPSEFRPIGLLSIFRLIYEKCILTSLTLSFTPHITQQGFTKKRCTLHNHIWSLNTSSPNTASLFIDFTKAFDHVDLLMLLHKLQDLFLNVDNPLPHLMQTILNLTLNNTTKLSFTDKSTSRIIHLHNGLPQGSALSPILFNIYTASLNTNIIKDIPPTLNQYPISGFADDFAIRTINSTATMTNSTSPSTSTSNTPPTSTISINHLQQAFQLIHSWSLSHKIPLSTLKTITVNYNNAPLEIINSDNTIIRIQDTFNYTYLGIPTNQHGPNLNLYFNTRLHKANKIFEALKVSPYATDWSVNQRRQIFLAFIRSQFEYNIILLNIINNSEQRLQIATSFSKSTSRFIRWITEPFTSKFPNYTFDIFSLQFLLNIPSFLDRLDFLTLKSTLFFPSSIIPCLDFFTNPIPNTNFNSCTPPCHYHTFLSSSPLLIFHKQRYFTEDKEKPQEFIPKPEMPTSPIVYLQQYFAKSRLKTSATRFKHASFKSTTAIANSLATTVDIFRYLHFDPGPPQPTSLDNYFQPLIHRHCSASTSERSLIFKHITNLLKSNPNSDKNLRLINTILNSSTKLALNLCNKKYTKPDKKGNKTTKAPPSQESPGTASPSPSEISL